MRVRVLLYIAMLWIVMVIGDTMYSLSDYEGSGRVFPLLPPYQGVDFAANFNKLKSSGDAAYFVVRDSIVVSIVYSSFALKTSILEAPPCCLYTNLSL